MSMRLPSSNLFGANEAPQFDTWNLANRPVICESYTLTTKYRQCKNPVTRRFKGVLGFKRKRRPESRAESEGGESNHSHGTSDIDFEKEFPDDFDYDEKENKTEEKLSNTPQVDVLIQDPPLESVTSTDIQEDTDPKTIIKRTPCQELYIRSCKFLDVIPASTFIRHLGDEKIQLRHHFLGPDGTKACCMALLSNSTVTTLDLMDTNLGADGARHIADLLRENHFITELSVAENELGIEGIRPILEVVEQLDNIISLNLSGTGLKEKDAEEFRGIFEETQHLKRLILSHNEFREIGGEIFGELIGFNDTIEVLDLSWNHLRNTGAKELAAGLEENKGLRVLDVSWNGFHLQGCKQLADALLVNTELQELNLNCNRINKDCLEKLLKGFKQNTTLRTLRLAWNPITSPGAQLVLNMCEERPDVGLKEIDIHTQLVEPSFTEAAHKLDTERGIKILYGMVRGQDPKDGDQDEDGLLQENPTLVLMEFARLMGFRPVDLLSTFDKDKSMSLDKAEIKMGLRLYCIPLSDRCLDFMVQKLDVDGDGEIDLNRFHEDKDKWEVMQAKTEYKLKEREMHNASKNWNFDIENTDIGRVRIKLQRLMQKKMDGNPTFRARVDLFQEALKEGKLKSVYNDKKDKAKERERIQQKRMFKRQQADDSFDDEGHSKLKLDLEIVSQEMATENSRIGSGSRRASARPTSGLQKLKENRRSSDSQSPKTSRPNSSLSSRPISGRSTLRPNSGHPSSTSRPKSTQSSQAGNSSTRSSRPGSPLINTGRRDSKNLSSNPNSERRSGSNGNDWKPLNF